MADRTVLDEIAGERRRPAGALMVVIPMGMSFADLRRWSIPPCRGCGYCGPLAGAMPRTDPQCPRCGTVDRAAKEATDATS